MDTESLVALARYLNPWKASSTLLEGTRWVGSEKRYQTYVVYRRRRVKVVVPASSLAFRLSRTTCSYRDPAS